MASDVIFTDGTAAITANVDGWTYDCNRMPKEFTLKSLAALGSHKSVTTDFGSFLEWYRFQGHEDDRADAMKFVTYAQDDWFENGASLSITVPALNSDDGEAIDFASVGGVSPIATAAVVTSDLDEMGTVLHRWELETVVCKKL